MTQLTDACALVKVLGPDGKKIPDGGGLLLSDAATIRYVIFNDSDKPLGPILVLGRLLRNGLPFQLPGQPDVVPLQPVTLQPNQVWTREFVLDESFGPNGAHYLADITADTRNVANEETEANNFAQTSFSTGQF